MPRPPVAALLLLATPLLASGCLPDIRLKEGLYTPRGPLGRSPARVALVVTPAQRGQSEETGMWPASFQRFYIGPAYPDAVRDMLKSLYAGVAVFSSRAGASGGDFVVAISSDFPNEIGLSFYDGRSGTPIASYSTPFGDPGACRGANKSFCVWMSIPTLLLYPIMGPIFAAVNSDENVQRAYKAETPAMNAAVASSLRRLARAIAADGKAQPASALKQIAAAEKSGDGRARRGNLAGALADYEQGLAFTWPDSPQGSRLREKMFNAAARIRPPPRVPDAALDHMNRGKALVKMAKDEKGFLAAADEMRRAVYLAPWWPDGYYNLGLVEGAAGDSAQAASDLRLYLKALPNGRDSRAVRRKIAEFEVKLGAQGRRLPAPASR